MTFVGKILVVLQIVLSLVFMAFAGAVFTMQIKWKAKADQLTADIAEMQTEHDNTLAERDKQISDQSSELEKVKLEERNAKASLADAEGRAKQANDELEKEKIRSTGFLQSLAIATEEAEQRRAEAVNLRVVNNDLHKKLDEMVASYRTLQEENFATTNKTKAMIAKHNQIVSDLALLRKAATLQGVKLDPQAYKDAQKPPTNVEGYILEARRGARNEPDFVEISIGSDDDLAKGHELFCFRTSGKGKYLGKIRIVHITPDRAVGVVIEKAKNGLIKKGDNVSTKL